MALSKPCFLCTLPATIPWNGNLYCPDCFEIHLIKPARLERSRLVEAFSANEALFLCLNKALAENAVGYASGISSTTYVQKWSCSCGFSTQSYLLLTNHCADAPIGTVHKVDGITPEASRLAIAANNVKIAEIKAQQKFQKMLDSF